MSLSPEERTIMVRLYLEKADKLILELDGARQLKMWSMAANRMYYAMLNALRALFVHDGHSAHTHAGMKSLFGMHYVTTGKISEDLGRLYSQMETLRERADYDCYFEASEEDVEESYVRVKDFVAVVKELIAK